MMFARNNDFRARQDDGPRPTEALLWSESGDGGATWTPHQYVPLESVVSRMHVLPAGGDRFVMVYNDWPAGRFVHDRNNLALFFTRGTGIDFVAGPGVTGHEPFVMYPQMWIEGDSLLVSYSQGNMPRSIKVSHVSPLPEPDRYYIFPRSNLPPPPAPAWEDNSLVFSGTQYIESRESIDLGDAFACGAWIRAEGDGVLIDNRTTNPQAGFLWGLAYREGKLHPYLYVGSPEHNLVSTLEVPRAEWSYVGLTVNHADGSADLYVNDRVERLAYSRPANPLTGTTPYIGHKRFEGSQVSGLVARVRRLVLYANSAFAADTHARLARWLAGEIEGDPTGEARADLWMDATDQAGLETAFKMPDALSHGAEVLSVDGAEVLRLRGEASAGIDLDENVRGAGDRVELRFRFRVENGDEHVICTVGDADEPARLVATAGAVQLEAGGQIVRVGQLDPGNWNGVELVTHGDRTFARANDGADAEVRHNPVATWAYLGHGYRTRRIPPENSFLVDVASLRSRVERAE
jgi:hypothetical protein